MPSVSHSPLQFQFEDFDAYAEAAEGWDLTTRLLDRGGFHADLFYSLSSQSGYHLARTTFHSRVHQTGTSPRNCITFGVTQHAKSQLQWRGSSLEADHLMVFGNGAELCAFTPQAFDVTLFSVPISVFQHVAEKLGYPHLATSDLRSHAVPCSQTVTRMLRYRMQSLQLHLTQISDASEDETLHLETTETLIPLLSAEGSKPINVDMSFRERAARQAVDYLKERADEVTSVSDLCQKTRASERTLQAGFRSLYGISPKQYIQACRLSEVNKALRIRGPEACIADIANQWGFWHMGQFAADYRRMFGELPSETKTNFM